MNPTIIKSDKSRNKPTLKFAELFKIHPKNKIKTKNGIL